MKNFWDWMMLILYVSALFLLVRPGSQGPKLISTLGSAVQGMIKQATGGGTWSGK
jgi:hypothetical protein